MARLLFPKYSSGLQNEGERRSIQFLIENLPLQPPSQNLTNFGKKGAEYIVIPNFEIPDQANRFLEIDAIVIAPHAVYVVEIKDWGLHIKGDDYGWLLNGNRERDNPHRALNYKCRVLRSIIGNESADLYKKVWFQGVVVIGRDKVVLDLNGNCEQTTFLLETALTSYLQDPLRLSTPKRVSNNEIEPHQKEITEIILNKGRSRKNQLLIIQGYQVEETLYVQDGLIEYLARSIHMPKNLKSSLKRLRVFTLPLHADETERQEQEQKILRDYEVLETIGTHPNIVSLKGFLEHEADQVVEVLDWSNEGTLRSLLLKGTLTLDQKIEIIKGIATGLEAAHKAGIIHRDLRPENVLMGDVPQLMNFDRAFMIESSRVTVWQTVRKDADRRYLSPELSLSSQAYDVYEQSDLYSLGAVFYELMCGKLPYDGPEGLEAAGGILPGELLPTKLLPGIPAWVDELINQLYASEVSRRFASATLFLAALNQKLIPSNQSVPSHASPVKASLETVSQPLGDPNRVFQPGERVGDYRITQLIKTGGFAQVYLASHVLHDKEYALKVNNQSVPLSSLIDEFRMLDQISHPNIVKVYWSGQLPAGRFYIAMEYLKGEALGEYAWGTKRLTISQVLEVGRDIVSALRYLHEGDQKTGELCGKTLYHRDLKPNNIIWVPGRGYVLIDFNIAKEAPQSNTFAGTTPYIAPDLIQGRKVLWDDSGDTFALGVTLYELICKQHPYPNNEPHLTVKPRDPRQTEAGKELSDSVCAFLLKTVQPKAKDRFRTAREMQAAIVRLETDALYYAQPPASSEVVFKLDEYEKQAKDYNPFVRRLRRLFSQARYNNAGTRGLDEIARVTYIQTKLDEELLPAIKNGEYRLVIITGNAGDGKTVLIQQLEAQASQVDPLPSKNGSRFVIKSTPFQSNYDGSQDEDDTPNDVVLEEFLKPFAGLKDFSQAPEGRILAINEGRLMEFLAVEDRKQRFGYLYEVVDEYFNQRGETTLPKYMMVVNLNWRSVVASSKNHPSLFEKQLTALLKPEFWSSCQQCAYQNRCFISHNAQTLSDSAAGPEIRERLSQIFEAVHLRRKLHITMRNLRSALSFLICRDHGCEDIPSLVEDLNNDEKKLNYVSLAYWNLTDDHQNDSGKQDRLISLIRQIDLGNIALPPLDRDIHFLPLEKQNPLGMAERTTDFTHTILSAVHQRVQEWSPSELDPNARELIKRQHKFLARKLYFEGREPVMRKRLPYSNLNLFKQVLNGNSTCQEQVRKTVVKAISLSEGCRNEVLAVENICLAANEERDPRWAAFRLFKEGEFELIVPELGSLGAFLEHTPDRFLLRHKKERSVALEVDLDLFELLTYVSKGFSPSLNDLQGRFIELIIFKNALRHLPYKSVLLTENHNDFYRIETENNSVLIMEKASTWR